MPIAPRCGAVSHARACFIRAAFCAVLLAGCGRFQSVPTLTPAVAASDAPSGDVPAFRAVFLIVMENHEYDQIVGSPDAPYINQLSQRYASADHYYAIQHPSLPNYLALFSGSNQGINNDCANCTVNAPNLADQLESHGKTWKSYQEDLPSPCFKGTGSTSLFGRVFGDGYVRRHNPAMYFVSIAENPSRCRNVVPYSQFGADLGSGQTADFNWITPSLRHDMHNGSIAEGDAWLAQNVPPILAAAAWRNGGLLVITWDEGTTSAGCCGAAGGRVLTIAIAPNSRTGYVSPIPYTHYSLLRTIEDVFGLPHLGHAADPETRGMGDLFRQPSG